MYQHQLHQQINQCLKEKDFPDSDAGILFHTCFIANGAAIEALYDEIYRSHPKARVSFASLLTMITRAFIERPESMKDKVDEKLDQGHWFLSNSITGMSLYVDRFAGRLKEVESRLDYLRRLGVNLLHLMPLFESPPGESDGGYAVSDYRSVDPRFGTFEDLKALRRQMVGRNMFLMLDIAKSHFASPRMGGKGQARDPGLPRLLLHVPRSQRA
jgi:amylosucrase